MSALAAAKRLRKELQALQKADENDPHIYLKHDPENLMHWEAWIKGPTETAYEDGVFKLDIRCGMDYPLSPPTMKFVTKVRDFAVMTGAQSLPKHPCS